MFLREHLFELELDEYRPLGDPTRFLDALATLFSRAKDEDVSPEAYLAHAGRLAPRPRRPAAVEAAGDAATEPDADAAAALEEEARRQAELARAYARYQRLLAANGAIDFGDQVSLALRLLRESPAARRARPGPLPVRAGGRVPGHQPRPVGARRAASPSGIAT